MSSTKTIAQAFAEARALDAPLDERLAVLAEAYRELYPDMSQAYDRLIERLAAAHAGDGAPQVGDAMPAFILPDHEGHLVSLNELLENDQLVVSFNRGHWCEHCKLELLSLAECAPEIKQHGGQIVSIVPDNQKFGRELRAELNLPFVVLSDMDNGYAMSLGLSIWVGEEVDRLYRKIGMDPSDIQGSESWLLPIPATFVVGRDGLIRARFVDPDFKQRMDAEEILKALGTG
ncbi:MAG: peroxiredoxin-like family protein [Hyphomicrobiaceae bacterium]